MVVIVNDEIVLVLTCYRVFNVIRTGGAPNPASDDANFEDHDNNNDNNNENNNENNHNKNATSWVVGRLMNAGEKVHIRNRQQVRYSCIVFVFCLVCF